MKSLKWGVISTANIAREKVIPALQNSKHNRVIAISSRDLLSAKKSAKKLDIEFAHGSYEELLQNPKVDAIYNPLPNHLHVDWSIAALRAGKHVLCEKPLGMDLADAQRLADEAKKFPELVVMEAFMYRFHPQWTIVKQLLQQNKIGKVRHVNAHFSYNNRDPENVRNFSNMGGGGLLDIGCYCISAARFVFGEEPKRVLVHITPFKNQEVDCLVSGVMEFSEGDATISAGTKQEPDQHLEIYGEAGCIKVPVPFNASEKKPAQVLLTQYDPVTKKTNRQKFLTETVDQYSAMGDAFALSVLKKKSLITPLSDALANMKIIDAMFKSSENRCWIDI